MSRFNVGFYLGDSILLLLFNNVLSQGRNNDFFADNFS